MNSTHDLGGMHGFGPVDRSQQENFVHPWERTVFALTLACGMLGRWNLDESRFARERMDPGDYLKSGYYEHWLHGLELLLKDKGLVTESELASGISEGLTDLTPVPADQVTGLLERGGPTAMESGEAPAYRIGEPVRIRTFNPKSHTRVPRYIRGKRGIIVTCHGAHVFPDRHAVNGGRLPAHLYTVRFEAGEIWGDEDAQGNSPVHVDVFEPYMEAACA